MLSERCYTAHVSISIVLENKFPATALRVHDHLIHDALSWGVGELLKIHI